MIKKALLGVAAVIVLFLGYVALKSPGYEVSREITINASADKIFPHMNNSKLAEKWGPWMETDPGAKMNYSGPDAGVGAKTSWDSTGQLGTGSATIVESVPNEKIGIALEYSKPFVMTQHSDYLLKAAGNQTLVTWRVTGKNNFAGRLMCSFFNMDKMVGGMFEKGLQNLKRLVEVNPK
jgi:hypothetical protein